MGNLGIEKIIWHATSSLRFIKLQLDNKQHLQGDISPIGIAIRQIRQTATLFEKNSHLPSFASSRLTSKPIHFFSFALPCVIAASIKSAKTESLKPTLCKAQKVMSKLYLVAAFVQSAVFTYFGCLSIGIPGLLIHGLGLLNETGFIGDCSLDTLTDRVQVITSLSELTFGKTILERICAACELGFLFYSHLPKKTLPIFNENNSAPTQYDVEAVKKALLNSDGLEVDRTYAKPSSLSTQSSLNLETACDKLSSYFTGIEWSEKNKHVLLRKLLHDHKFSNEKPILKKKINQLPITQPEWEECLQWTKDSLDVLISRIREKNICSGNASLQERIEHTFRQAIELIEKKSDNEVFLIDSVLRLSIEAGKYCDSGCVEVFEEIVEQNQLQNEVVFSDATISFDLRLMHELEKLRKKTLDSFIYQTRMIINSAQKMSWIQRKIYQALEIDSTDKHDVNTFISLCGSHIGIKSLSAESDVTTPKIDLAAHLYGKWMGDFIWLEMNSKNHIEWIQEAFKNKILNTAPFFEFWNSWIKKNLADEEQTQALDDLANIDGQGSRLFGAKIFDENGQPTEAAIRATLLILGVLKPTQKRRRFFVI